MAIFLFFLTPRDVYPDSGDKEQARACFMHIAAVRCVLTLSSHDVASLGYDYEQARASGAVLQDS